MSVFISHLVFATVATITNVSHVQFDTQASTVDVRVSHVQLDTLVHPTTSIISVKPSYGGGWQSISNKKVKRKPRDKFEEFQIIIDGMIFNINPPPAIASRPPPTVTLNHPRSRAERRASEENLLIL